MNVRKEIHCRNNIWPINYKDETREEFIRVTLKSLIFYLIFVLVATIVILSKTSITTYRYTQTLKDQFIDVDFITEKNYPTVFDDIRTVDHFWRYLSKVAISSLYNTEWFNLYYQPIKILTEPRIVFEFSLVGVARLRMYQVTNTSCPIVNFFNLHIKKCFGYFSERKSDTHHVPWSPVTIISDYVTTVKPTTKAPGNITEEMDNITGFNFSEPEHSTPTFGYFFLSYNNTGGFIQKFGRSKNESLLILQTLYTKKWITRATRLVLFEFNVFLSNMNLLFDCKLIFEFHPCGGITPSYYFQPIFFARYKYPFDFVILSFELIFILFIIYFIVQEFINCTYYRNMYWKSFWSYVNIFIIISSVLAIILNIYKIFSLPEMIKEALNSPNDYVNMDLSVFWQWFINNLEAILLFVIWFKLLRFFNLNKTMRVLGTTLGSIKHGIFSHILNFQIILIGFTLIGFVLFGEESDFFNNFGNAYMTMLLIIPGYYNYYTIVKNNEIIGTIFFLSYIIIVYFLFFFMIIGVVLDAFSNAKQKAASSKPEIGVSEFLSRLPHNLMLICCPRKKHLKMSAKEIVSEIRKILELSKFTNNGVKRFFRVYGIHEDKYIDNKNVLELLNDMKTFIPQVYCTLCSPEEIENNMKLKTFLSHQSRFDSLGDQLFHISIALDELTDSVQEKSTI